MHIKPSARLVAYALAVFAPEITLLARWPLPAALADQYSAFLPAVLIAAYVGGFGPGLLATVVSALAATFFLVEPHYSFAINSGSDAVALVVFLLVGVIISGLMESLDRSRRRIAASERRYAVTLASIGDAVIATDARARVTFLNPVAEALTGWPLADAVGRPLAEVFRIVHEQTRQSVEDPAAKVLRLGTVVGLANHTALVARDGREVPIDDCGAPIIDDRGAIAGVVLVFRDVTQRRQAEEAEVFRRFNERMELALRGSNVGVWDHETPAADYRHRRRHYVNVWEQLGHEGPPAGGETPLDAMHPDDRDRVEEAVRRYLAGESTEYETEARFRHRDGSYRTLLVRGVAVRDAAGKPTRFVGVTVDITQLRLAEEELRRTTQLFQAVADGTQDAVYVKDREGRHLMFNAAASRMVGKPIGEVLGRDDTAIFDPDSARTVMAHDRRVMESGVADTDEKALTADGVTRTYLASKAPYRDGQGNIIGIIGICHDISERKRAEEALRESEERFRGTFENAAVGIAHVDGRHCCVRANEVFCDLIGYSPTEAVGKTIESVVYPDDLPANLAQFDHVMRGELSSFRMEKRFNRKNGEIVWALLNVSLQRDLAGKPDYCIVIAQDISERKRLEEELRQAHARLDLAMRGSNLSIWECDVPDGRIEKSRITFINQWELLGYDPATSPTDFPSVIATLFYPEDQKRLKEELGALFSGDGREYESEFRVRWQDGSTRWHLSRGTVLRDPEGKPIRFIGTSADITDLKRAEEALRESERRFRTFVDHATDAFFLFDDEHVVLDVNRQACQSLGYTRDQLLGMTPLDFDPDITPDRLEELKGRLDDGQLMAFESHHRRGDGAVFPVEIRGEAFWESGRRLTVALARDVTERTRAEAALRESEERFRGTFENAPVGIAHEDLTGRFLRLNERFCTILGYPQTELVGKTLAEVTHPEDLAADLARFSALTRGESTSYTMEKRFIRKEGRPVWAHLTVSLQFDAAGKPAYCIKIIQDISDRKRLDEELRQAKEMAEAANRAKDEFLANVSHEIRTPMNAILGMTELTLDTPLADEQRQYLKTVQSAADNLLGILNDLLDFSKIEAGKLELDPADFSLRAALGETLRTLATRAHKKGLELVSHVETDVPDALVGDASRLRQVLLNLVGNAIKFTDEGEVVLRVEATALPAPDGQVWLCFTVSDTGIGISHEKHETIFRPFEQEDTSTTRKYGGTGLGLTIAARLVALMDGTITVESEPGRSSTFAFTVRFERQVLPAEPVAAPPPVLLYNLPVLIVDDNATNRRILEEWLRGWKMEPVARGDGLAALDAIWHGVASGRPYPLVLLDARMPDTDGLTLAATIRERVELAATRIILLTSGDISGDLHRYRELRIDAQLLKPVQQDELLETIYRVMSRNKADPPTADRHAPAQETASAPAPATASLHILVAEDNEFNAQLLEQLLLRRGHRVRVASNGREALPLAQDGVFDLLLLDVHMPELDGFQVVSAVRERERTTGKHLPVIALTARSRKEDRQRCLAAGMDDFLSKPVRAADLWAAIDRVVASRPPAAELRLGLLNSSVLWDVCGGDAGVLDRICGAFQARVPDHLEAVHDALRQRDASQLREAAHKLSGMLAAFSEVAGGVASDLEDHAASGRLEEARPLVQQLEAMVHELLLLVGGLSLETLRLEAEATEDP